MKTINETKFRKLSAAQLNETMGGYDVILILPNGQRIRVKV